MINIPPTSSDEMKEAGIIVDTRPFIDPYSTKDPDDCIVCGNHLELVRSYPATCGLCKTLRDWKGTVNHNVDRRTAFQEDYPKTNNPDR